MAFGLGGSGAYKSIASWSGAHVVDVSVGENSNGTVSIVLTTANSNNITVSGPAGMNEADAQAYAIEVALVHERAFNELTRAERRASRGGGYNPTGDMTFS